MRAQRRGSLSSFDRDFAKTEKTVRRGFGLIAAFAVVQMAVYVALLIGLVYVAVHFLGKVW